MTSSTMTFEGKQRLREETLRLLGKRFPESFRVSAILFAVRDQQRLDAAPAEGDILDALAYLDGLGFVVAAAEPMGAFPRWSATTSGVQYYERNLAG